MTALRVRMRPDLQLETQGEAADRCWIAKDPVALRYFRLRDEEYFILRLLDGTTPLEEIRLKFEATFQPLRLGVQQLHGFILRLHEQGLIVSETPGQGEILHRRAQRTRRQQTQAIFANPLAIRLPGIGGGPLLDVLYPRLKWIFSPLFLIACAVLVLGTIGCVLLEFDSFSQRLARMQSIFVPQAVVPMLVVMVVVKALHELGHALTCRRFKARCQEIGVMLLIGTPTLYCDVTDAWRLPNKWQRILISSAGMLVELVLASIATIIWWQSPPGIVNMLASQTMFVCSVGTLAFNLNPLLRCDGYYILSDWLEVPNLWQDARGLLQRRVYRLLFGLESQEDATLPAAWEPWLLAYAIGSILYSLLLVSTILAFLFRVLEPQGLASIAWIAAAVIVVGMGSRTVMPVIRAWNQPGRKSLRRGRTSLIVAAAIALIGCFAFVPVPKTVRAKVWLEAGEARGVFVPLPGKLESIVPAGTVVKQNDIIARLSSAEVDRQRSAAAGLAAEQATRVKNLKLLLNDDPTQAAALPAAIKTLEDRNERLAQWNREAERLVLRAPCDGIVRPPPLVKSPGDLQRLTGWVGSPFDPQNLGCQLETGTLLCEVGPEAAFSALLLIDPVSLADAAPGQAVRITIDALPGRIAIGTIGEIAESHDDELPAEVIRALKLPQEQAAPNSDLPTEYHLARVALAGDELPLRVGMTGSARIAAAWEPLLPRLWRYASRTWK